MRLHSIGLLLLTAACVACGKPALAPAPADWVDPFIGTDGPGNVYPGASAPFGLVQLSPDNGRGGWDWIAGYFHPDTVIAGFSHTHLSGTGAGDLYDICFMPVVEPLKHTSGIAGPYSLFSHDLETASPGYYQVFLKDYGVNVELTATERCGMQRYTFPKTEQATVILDLARALNWDATEATDIHVVDSCTIEGYRFSTGWAPRQEVWFEARFSQPFVSYQIDTVLSTRPGVEYGNDYIMALRARFSFNTVENPEVIIRTGISAVSAIGARTNLQAEMPSFDFDSVRHAVRTAWNRELSKIEVKGGTPAERTIFYTALYRTMLAPTLFSDVNGQYYGADGQVHNTDGKWQSYSTFSLWDTYRAAHPLYTLTHPDRMADMVQTMLAFYDQHRMLPVWPLWGRETDMMIGYHSVPVLVEAYLKGLVPADWGRRILDACVATANSDDYRGIGLYKKLGYVPADQERESLSKTLEYAYDDHCIALLARKLDDQETYNTFLLRSKNYRNLFQPASGFMQPRLSGGEWFSDFDPKAYTEHITESNGWQYLWSVAQDVEGLIRLMRGPEAFEKRLDQFFTLSPTAADSLPIFSTGMIGQYAHGNEPSHHVAYLYNYVGRPEKTQQYVSQILRKLYTAAPDGLCGNEDCGQMSAWYVFSAMGFYPVDPVSLTYAIGTPLFEEATIHLAEGKAFTVQASGFSAENYRVSTMTLNGHPLSSPFLTWEQIQQGGVLKLVAVNPAAETAKNN